jgi:alpha-galactosidase
VICSSRITRLIVAVLIVAGFGSAFAQNTPSDAATAAVAPTPPMGWNSWDAYAFSLDENTYTANATVLAGLKQFGWQYAVIDEGWYFEHPLAKREELKPVMDAYGRLIPVPSRFPSASDGAGFKPLIEWTHQQGLKFGIHIIRGIPRDAFDANMPIAGSNFHAQDAGDKSDVCPWDSTTYGIKNTPAGQAYYDSIISLYAGWGVDFLKVDCISDHTYKPDEIVMIAAAIRKSGRPIVLSLSPGPTALSSAPVVTANSQMWRTMDDQWDAWNFPKGNPWGPTGVLQAFDALAKWQPFTRPGNWPDADMLPWGSLRPHPGWGDARQSRLTQDEQRTQFTLWAMARSPLILGTNLTELDDFTKSLITNKDVIAVDQHAVASHQVTNLPAGWEKARAWVAEAAADPKAPRFIAIFNLDEKPVTLSANWKQLGLRGTPLTMRDLFGGKTMKAPGTVTVTLAPHASALYRVDLVTPRAQDSSKEVCSFWCP